jgi:AbiU2
MSAEQQLAKAKRFTARVHDEIIRAIGLHALWMGCTDGSTVTRALRGQIWFSLLRGTLHVELLMTLCRLHEHGREENATIPVVCSLIAGPNMDILLADSSAAHEAIRLYAGLQRSGLVRRLRVIRDRVIAHNDMRRTERTAAYGDETMLLEQSAGIADRIHVALMGSESQFALYRETWRHAAESYWNRVVSGGEARWGEGKVGKRLVPKLAEPFVQNR